MCLFWMCFQLGRVMHANSDQNNFWRRARRRWGGSRAEVVKSNNIVAPVTAVSHAHNITMPKPSCRLLALSKRKGSSQANRFDKSSSRSRNRPALVRLTNSLSPFVFKHCDKLILKNVCRLSLCMLECYPTIHLYPQNRVTPLSTLHPHPFQQKHPI